jgi:prepilin-type N-terminal cleavage/methylation domain-containing protein
MSRNSFIGLVPKNSSGFTLMEVLVVMAIFILIAGIALYVSMDSYRSFVFRSERDTIINVLQRARSQAVSNVCLGACNGNDGQKHGVHFDTAGKKYVIFQTTSNYIGRDISVDLVVPINSSTMVFTPNPPADIIFNRLDGSTTGGSFAISETAAHSSQIIVNAEGQIDNP